MKEYRLELTLLSPALAGSGQGYGAIIDTDIVFDDAGLPRIPAKRIKGCLKDAAAEVKEMFEEAGIKFPFSPDAVFGKPGEARSAPVYFSDLTIPEYDSVRKWLDYYLSEEKYRHLITADTILETFTEIRQQTRINENGTAFDGSLRTSRVIQKGRVFSGDVHIDAPEDEILDTLAFACKNFRNFGTQRTRGYGHVECVLMDKGGPYDPLKKLEALCRD